MSKTGAIAALKAAYQAVADPSASRTDKLNAVEIAKAAAEGIDFGIDGTIPSGIDGTGALIVMAESPDHDSIAGLCLKKACENLCQAVAKL